MNKYYISKSIYILAIIFIVLSCVVLTQNTRAADQTNASVVSTSSTSSPLELPENFGQAKNFIIPILKNVPRISLGIFRNQVEPYWKRLAIKGEALWSHFWYSFLKPKIQVLIDKIIKALNLKWKEKEPQVKKNFQKQKNILGQEIQNQLPGIKKTLWERIKDLLR